MALTNYSDLQSTIANYLGRSDLTAQIPDFISLAEIRIGRELRIRQMLKTVTAQTTASDSTVGLPSDFLQIKDIFVDGSPRYPLTFMAPAVFSRNARATDTGRPVFYTMRGAEFEFAPIPDTDYTLQMIYYAKPQALSSTNPSNVFMAVCPDALLYGALIETEPYLMNDARIQTWSNFYNSAVTRLNAADDESEFAGVPLTMKVISG